MVLSSTAPDRETCPAFEPAHWQAVKFDQYGVECKYREFGLFRKLTIVNLQDSNTGKIEGSWKYSGPQCSRIRASP